MNFRKQYEALTTVCHCTTQIIRLQADNVSTSINENESK